MVALADNIGGTVFSNASIRVGQTEISSITTGLSQVSALNARIDHGAAWLDSLGSGASVNVAEFSKRNMLTASDSAADACLDSKNEMYKPVVSGTYATATVAISAITVAAPVVTKPNASFVRGPVGGVATAPVVDAVGGANPYSALLLANAITDVTVAAPVVTGGVVTQRGCCHRL